MRKSELVLPLDRRRWPPTRRRFSQTGGERGTFLILLQHSFHATIPEILLANTAHTHTRARAVSMTLRTTTPFVLTNKLRLWLIWRDRHYFQNLCGTSTVTWGTPPHNQSQKEVSPVAPIDASLLFAVDGPMVVGEVLHGDGVLAQRLLILAVLAPDLVEVAHCGGKERDGIRKKKRSAARDSGCKIRARFQSRKPSKGNLGGVTELKKIGGRHLFGRKRTKATGGHFQRTIPTWWL